jgi:solute carrier family 25 (mitochondrial phosphate transporter), member 3
LLSLWSGFAPILARELPFAIAKFITFDTISSISVDIINANMDDGVIPVQVGIGTAGLTISALSGAIAGVAGALVSHPADLILTKTSAAVKKGHETDIGWVDIVRDLIGQEGGIANLFVGLSSRSVFFFLVIGLQVSATVSHPVNAHVSIICKVFPLRLCEESVSGWFRRS